jgi:PEP-CTERM motif
VALALNLDFNNAGDLHGTSSIPFGGLLLTNFSGGLTGLNGLTVSQFLAIANTCLGNGSCPYGLDNIAAITDDLNGSFAAGTVSTFADTNLALPSSVTPEPSSLLLFGTSLLGLVPFRRKLFGR